MKYYSAIEKNETGSFVEMWTDLETVIESEEKNKYRILTDTCGIWKIGIDNIVYKAEIETQF